MIKMKIQKHDQVLPEEVRAQLRFTKDIGNKGQLKAHIKVLRNKGWTYQCIGEALYLTRERARQLAGEAHTSEINRLLEDPVFSDYLPTPPLIAYELKPLAERVRSSSKTGRVEAEEYVALLHYANTVENVSIYQLARALGVTRLALSSRLIRYGYAVTTSTTRTFAPINEENRVRS
jgi:hypothetical protein